MLTQPAAINARLGELCAYLNRKSRNFTASMRVFRVVDGAALPPAELVRRAFGPSASLSSTARVELRAVLDTIEAALLFSGAPGAHPNPRMLTDPDWQTLIERALGDLGELLAPSPTLHAMTLADGHPFYPVYWDVAFAFTLGADGCVLVGAASD